MIVLAGMIIIISGAGTTEEFYLYIGSVPRIPNSIIQKLKSIELDDYLFFFWSRLQGAAVPMVLLAASVHRRSDNKSSQKGPQGKVAEPSNSQAENMLDTEEFGMYNMSRSMVTS